MNTPQGVDSPLDEVEVSFNDLGIHEEFIDPAMPNCIMIKFTHGSPGTPGLYRPKDGGNQYHAGPKKRVIKLLPSSVVES